MLSGSQKHHVAMVHAILKNPSILLLDEGLSPVMMSGPTALHQFEVM
jgi:ABC-type sugar transport system ATPase subunit